MKKSFIKELNWWHFFKDCGVLLGGTMMIWTFENIIGVDYYVPIYRKIVIITSLIMFVLGGLKFLYEWRKN